MPFDEPLLKRKRECSKSLFEQTEREFSFTTFSRINNVTVQNVLPNEAKEKMMEEKEKNHVNPRSSKRNRGPSQKITLSSFLPQITKSLNNYLKNDGINDGVFEPLINYENRRRNPNSIVTIDRYNVKKVPQEFKDYVFKTFGNMNESEQLTEGEFYSEMKSLKNEVSSIQDFFMFESNNFINTDEVMNYDFDSDSEDERKNECKFKQHLEKKQKMQTDTNEDSLFGINPIKEYGILCKWYKEEMGKYEKLKTNQDKLENLNLCKKIIKKIKQVSQTLSEMPFLRFKKSNPIRKIVRRKSKKKPKTFECTLCLESFKTGCGLGK
jgi:hypothetical protein